MIPGNCNFVIISTLFISWYQEAAKGYTTPSPSTSTVETRKVYPFYKIPNPNYVPPEPHPPRQKNRGMYQENWWQELLNKPKVRPICGSLKECQSRETGRPYCCTSRTSRICCSESDSCCPLGSKCCGQHCCRPGEECGPDGCRHIYQRVEVPEREVKFTEKEVEIPKIKVEIPKKEEEIPKRNVDIAWRIIWFTMGMLFFLIGYTCKILWPNDKDGLSNKEERGGEEIVPVNREMEALTRIEALNLDDL